MTIHFSIRSAWLAALVGLSLALTAALPSVAVAKNAARPTTSAPPATASAPAASNTDTASSSSPQTDAADNSDSDNDSGSQNFDEFGRYDRFNHRRRFHGHDNDMVSVWHDASVQANTERDSVVAVFGSASNYGTAHGDVVSVFGDTTVEGPAEGGAVAVMGNVTVNADVSGDVVAVMGSVTLGPNAHVHGQVVSVMGTVNQDPAAIVEHGIDRVMPGNFTSAQSLRTWVGHGLLLGRPLVIGSGMQWLWGFSFALLALYTILALLFRDAADHCIATLNANPGKSFVTAILAVLLTPLMMLLLVITVVGIPVIPIFLVTLFIAGVFGKATVLGWIGSRCLGMRAGQTTVHPAIAVLMGGILVMLAYLVPILGFVLYIILSMIGYGAVLYALLNRFRRSTSGGPQPSATAPAGGASQAYAAAGASAASTASSAGSAEPQPQASNAEADAAQSGAGTAPASEPVPDAVAPLPASTLPRPGFWVRIGALFIDSVIIGFLVPLLVGWHSFEGNRLFLLALAVYGAVMWKVKGTTIGGIVFDLRVVRLDSRALDWPTVCVRSLGCILSVCALGLGFLWIGIDPGKQAWHDKLAGTIVVRVPKGTPLV